MTEEIPQHLKALALANEIRLAQAELKGEVRRGELSLADALEDPRAQRLRVEALLMAQWRWGVARARRALLRAGIVERRTVAELTPRQRRVLPIVVQKPGCGG